MQLQGLRKVLYVERVLRLIAHGGNVLWMLIAGSSPVYPTKYFQVINALWMSMCRGCRQPIIN